MRRITLMPDLHAVTSSVMLLPMRSTAADLRSAALTCYDRLPVEEATEILDMLGVLDDLRENRVLPEIEPGERVHSARTPIAPRVMSRRGAPSRTFV